MSNDLTTVSQDDERPMETVLQASEAFMFQEDDRVFCQDVDSATFQAWPM